MTQKELGFLLVDALGISEVFAESASKRLLECSDSSIASSVIEYAQKGNKTYLEKRGYNTDILQKEYDMDYLNAALMIAWLETDPMTAKSALDAGYDDVW